MAISDTCDSPICRDGALATDNAYAAFAPTPPQCTIAMMMNMVHRIVQLAFSCLVLMFLMAPGFGRARTPPTDAHPPDMHHEHHGMRMDLEGMVMNENVDQLPRDCPSISGGQTIIVRVGRQYAQPFNGAAFTYDQREWNVPPCAKVTVTLINEDHVRHQWMLHDLPRYLYPEGMFHLEVNGPGQKSGTFIVPSAKKTYLVHCDIAQHTEKGMKAQLKVGGGNGDLPSILGITGPRQTDVYAVRWNMWASGLVIIAACVGLVLTKKLTR